MNPDYIVIAIITAIVAYTFIVYILGRRRDANSIVWNWWHRLVSTTASVLLGVVVGIETFNFQSKERRQSEIDRCVQIVAAEASDIYRVLKDQSSMTVVFSSTEYPALVTFIQPIAIEDAARSGLFSPLNTENLLHLARKIRLFDREMHYLLELLAQNTAFNPRFEERVMLLTSNMETTRQSILSDINRCAIQLGFKLSESINIP